MRPTAFVTYAHDSEKHKADVLELATLLQESGIETDLDQWATDQTPPAEELADHGRNHKLFDVTAPLTVDSSDQIAFRRECR